MAKKTINVVYKVDDSELTKVKAKIQDVEKATKASETAMTSMSQKGQQGNVQVSNTIAGMTLQMQRLKAQIELTKTSDTERLNKLKADYQAVKKQVDDFNKSLESTNKTGQSSLGVFQNLQTTIIGIFSVVAVKQLISWNLEMNKLAGNVQTVDAAFRRAFPNSDLLINKLRASTHGTINDFELMKRTLQATNLGVNVEHLGTLFEFAAVRAQQTGESVDYLVDSIVRGIGRKSILVLDNLGLSATRLRAEFGGTSIASKSVGEVTEGVVRIAKVELEKMGGYVETSATKVDQLTVSWEKLKQEIAKKSESSGLVSFWDDILKRARMALQSAEEARQETVGNVASGEVNKFIQGGKQTVETINKEIQARSQNIMSIRAELAAKSEGTRTDITRRAVLNYNWEVQMKEIELLQSYATQLEKNKKPQVESVGYIQAIKDEIDALNQAISDASRTELPALNEKLDQLQQKLKVAQIARPIKPSEEKAIDDQQALKDANDIIEKETEKHYQRSLGMLRDNIKDERNEKDIARALENQKTKDANKAIEDAEKEHQDYMKQIKQAALNYGLNALDQILTATLINRQTDTSDLESYYQAQLDAAGNNESAKKQIQKKIDADRSAQRLAQKQQDMDDAITKIEIDTAVGIIRALVTAPVPNFLLAGIVAGAGAIQAATVRSVSSRSLKTRAFAKGEVDIDGPGPKGVDSINAIIAPGESVINHEATAASRNLLEAINDRKIDDRILYRIAADGGRQAGTFDDSGIIRAIENSKVDYAAQGYTLMKVEKQGNNFKRYIRSKVQGY